MPFGQRLNNPVNRSNCCVRGASVDGRILSPLSLTSTKLFWPSYASVLCKNSNPMSFTQTLMPTLYFIILRSQFLVFVSGFFFYFQFGSYCLILFGLQPNTKANQHHQNSDTNLCSHLSLSLSLFYFCG